MDLSIVIPVYNEAHKISGDIAAAQEFLRDNGLTGEIIIVDDGSTDQTMAMASQGTSVIVLGDGQHHGKGWACGAACWLRKAGLSCLATAACVRLLRAL